MSAAKESKWEAQKAEVLSRMVEEAEAEETDEEWEEAESAALALAETTNVLLIPGRRVPEANWDKAALDVREVALEAAAAAEKKDEDAWFAAGGKLDGACEGCPLRELFVHS